jgi:hypothetical protein
MAKGDRYVKVVEWSDEEDNDPIVAVDAEMVRHRALSGRRGHRAYDPACQQAQPLKIPPTGSEQTQSNPKKT